MLKRSIRHRAVHHALVVFLIIVLPCLMLARQGCGQNLTSIAQPDLAGKNILLLHSYSYEQAAYLIMDPIFVKRFADAGLDLSNVNFEFLDLSKRLESSYWKEVARSLRIKYKGRMVDLIILLHPTALDFLIQECKGFFPGVPVIHVIATTGFIKDDKRPDLERQLESLRQPFIVMPFRVDARATVDAILRLKPDTARLMVLGGAGPLEERLEETVRADLKHWQGVLEIEYARGLPMDEILRRVAMVPPETAILLTTFYTDGTGRQFRPADAGRMISRAAKAPVFGLFETLLGNDGIVGGIMVNQGQEAERAASMALDILRGRKLTEPLMIVPTPLVPMFDWQQLKRWGLNGINLPPESIIINYQTTFWSQYKAYILGGLALLLMQAIFIVALLVQSKRKRIIEETLREKNEELDQFFNVSLDMLCIANTDGYFISLNPSFESVLGYTTQELMAKPFLEFVHPDDREATKEVMATLDLQRIVHYLTNRYRCTDGSYRWFEWRSVPVGNLIYAAARDITDRKKAEESLKERLEFEHLLSVVSTKFVAVPAERIDQEISEAMQRISEHLSIDLAVLWQLIETSSQFFTVTHLYRSLEGPPVPEKTNAKDLFPWCLKQISNGNIIIVPSTEDMPEDGAHDQKVLHRYGIKSFITFPLSAGGGPIIGALSFNSILEKRVWPEEIVKRLRLVAEIFANALMRKKSEQTLHESEERLSLASDSARIGLWILDLNTRQFWTTAKALELFGLMPECTLDFDTFIKLVHHEDRDQVLEAVNQALLSDRDALIEYRIVKADNSIRWMSSRGRRQLNTTGKVERLMGVTLDITERQNMEQKIQRAAQEWQTTFDNIPDLVIILDTEFRIVRINAAVRSYFGLPIEEIIGAHCYALLHGEEKPDDFCPYMKTLESRGHEEAEFHDDKRKVWLRASTDPVIGDSGEVAQVIYTLKDITERKRAEAEAFAARKELWRTDRLLRMGELPASLAHELNQPLTAILSNARAAIRFIKSDRFDMNELTEILEDIAKDDKRAGDIIRGLRAMLRPEEGEHEVININDLLGESIALFNSEAIIRNIAVETRFSEFLPSVVANRIQLQQVVINLLMNAAESMAESTMNVYEDRKIVIETCTISGDRVRVAVRDYGVGVGEQELGRIFEPFFTTKHTGLGMGLSLARSIIEGQAGHIWAENNPDGGATFYFDLPGVRQ